MSRNSKSDLPHQLTQFHLEKSKNSSFLVFVAAALFLAWYRLRFGVDFTDEAFYSAMSYRFALGDKPFVDELSAGQTFAFLTFPFTKLYLWWNGGLEGIVLFMRHLYLGFACGIAVVVYCSLKFFVRRKIAILTALSCVVSCLYLPTLSYNTLSSGLLVMALFSGLYIREKEVNPWNFLWTGIFFGLTIIAYPPLLLAVIFYVAVIIPWLRYRRIHSMSACLAGILLVGIAFVPLLMQVGSAHLATCLEYANSLGVQGGGLLKLKLIVHTLIFSFPRPALLSVLIVLIGITYHKRPLWCGLLLLMWPLTFMPLWSFSPTTGMMFINYYSLSAPLLAILIWHKKSTPQLFLGVWLPAFVAGCITAWSSGNGALNASVGWFAGALITVVLMALVLDELDQREKSVRQFRLKHLQWLPAFGLALFLLQNQFRSGTVYRDNDIGDLTHRVASGPYRGMYTTPTKYAYLQTMTRDINQVVGSEQTILFYDSFPAGYLLSSARPSTPSMWMQPVKRSPKIKRNLLVNYYQRHNTPDIVVQMFQMPQGNNTKTSLMYPAEDVFNDYIQKKYQPILQRDSYQIMRIVTIATEQKTTLNLFCCGLADVFFTSKEQKTA